MWFWLEKVGIGSDLRPPRWDKIPAFVDFFLKASPIGNRKKKWVFYGQVDRKGRGGHPYGQSDHKIAVFYNFPQEPAAAVCAGLQIQCAAESKNLKISKKNGMKKWLLSENTNSPDMISCVG